MHNNEPIKSADAFLIVSVLLILSLLLAGIITLIIYFKKKKIINFERVKMPLKKSNIIMSTVLFATAIPTISIIEIYIGDILLFNSIIDIKLYYCLTYFIISAIMSILSGFLPFKVKCKTFDEIIAALSFVTAPFNFLILLILIVELPPQQ
jgi:hypothetical protein